LTDADPIAGVLPIDKPEGPTSMAVCARVRAALRAGGAPKRIKVGHGGTLDPLATGLVVVLVGPATRLCDQVMAGEKRYTAEIDLRHTSPTDDRESEPVPAEVAGEPGLADVEAVLPSFTGRIMQAPPAHSAMKVGGKRAYELARAGEIDRLEPRPVIIHELRIERYAWPSLVLDVRCGKGTYIRSLARDIGRALGVGGMLWGLRRTGVGRFDVGDAVPMRDLPRTLTRADLRVTPEVEAILERRRAAERPGPRRDAPPAPDLGPSGADR
jgi:tRNA pseudouridine55 synthase